MIDLNESIEFSYKLAVIKDGKVKEETDECFNIVTDKGLLCLTELVQMNEIAIGKDNLTPTSTHFTLTPNHVTTRNITSGAIVGFEHSTNDKYHISKLTRTFRFTKGQLNGTYHDIGLVVQDNPDKVFGSRTLIKNNNKQVSPVSVDSEESLDVIVNCYIYTPLVIANSTIQLLARDNTPISTHTFKMVPGTHIVEPSTTNTDLASITLLSSNIDSINEELLNKLNSGNPSSFINNQIANVSSPKITETKPNEREVLAVFTDSQANYFHKWLHYRYNRLGQTRSFVLQIEPPIEKTNEMILEYTLVDGVTRHA